MERLPLLTVQLACALGLINAAFSLYWALGGKWLIETVGQGPQDLVKSSGLGAGVVLGLIAMFKALAATIPLLNALGRMPWPRLWRGISWVGGIFLILYGGGVALTSWLVLLGVIQTAHFDRAAMLGHAALWDPLFLIWGAALIWHLWLIRSKGAT